MHALSSLFSRAAPPLTAGNVPNSCSNSARLLNDFIYDTISLSNKPPKGEASRGSAVLSFGNEKGVIMAQVISSSEFEPKVLNAQGPVLVDFFATWCGPCKMLAPILDEVAAEVQGKAAVYKVDVDASPDLAQRYGVMSVPTLIVFENGQIKRSTMGAQPKQSLLALLA